MAWRSAHQVLKSGSDSDSSPYARAEEPKELHIIDGGTHFDFYDRPEYVDPAIAKIDEFFQKSLS
ncbi:MAG TPA: alpha/beta hydrolase [Acidimicrobiia bacterium]